MDKKAKQSSALVIFLCWAAYTVAYLGRLNFNAYIEPIREQIGASKTEMGLVSSFFFFSYGAGQLIHGILSRKYNTRYSIAVALIGSALANVGMALCPGVAAMKYVWLLCGVFQSILWSSLIKTLSDRLPDEMLSKAVVVMSTTAALGTFLSYGLSALFSSMHVDYRWIFYAPAAVLTAVGVLWFLLLGKADRSIRANESAAYVPKAKQRPSLTPVFVSTSILLVFAAISNGFIKDGVTTWTPSILKERYGMEASMSILITVLLPLIAIFGATISATLYKRMKSTSKLDAVFYGIETLVLLLVFLLARARSTNGIAKSPMILIVLFACSAMLMAAVNNVITSIIPLTMRDRMDSGLLAGVLDTFCYVGSTLSTALLGYIADHGSWNGVFLCLLLFGAAACLCCAISIPIGKKAPDHAM